MDKSRPQGSNVTCSKGKDSAGDFWLSDLYSSPRGGDIGSSFSAWGVAGGGNNADHWQAPGGNGDGILPVPTLLTQAAAVSAVAVPESAAAKGEGVCCIPAATALDAGSRGATPGALFTPPPCQDILHGTGMTMPAAAKNQQTLETGGGTTPATGKAGVPLLWELVKCVQKIQGRRSIHGADKRRSRKWEFEQRPGYSVFLWSL